MKPLNLRKKIAAISKHGENTADGKKWAATYGAKQKNVQQKAGLTPLGKELVGKAKKALSWKESSTSDAEEDYKRAGRKLQKIESRVGPTPPLMKKKLALRIKQPQSTTQVAPKNKQVSQVQASENARNARGSASRDLDVRSGRSKASEAEGLFGTGVARTYNTDRVKRDNKNRNPAGQATAKSELFDDPAAKLKSINKKVDASVGPAVAKAAKTIAQRTDDKLKRMSQQITRGTTAANKFGKKA